MTLLVVLTQTISIGVVDEPLVLANGTRLMPGDRVLAIHDSTYPWLAFLRSGEFQPLDSSKVVISGDWQAPEVSLRNHPDVDSGLWSKPDRKSGRVSWHSEDQRVYFSPWMPCAFSYRDSSFWASERSGETTIWFPLTREEVTNSMSEFGSSADSTRARTLFDLADNLRLGRDRTLLDFHRLTANQKEIFAYLYELSFEISLRHGWREKAANALLTLATFDVERGADTAGLTQCTRARREFVGIQSMYGRTDAYATWQMMEIAWRRKDIAQTCSLARLIVNDYPTEVGEERLTAEAMFGLTYGMQSIWFDVSAADRLLQAAAGDETQVEAAAGFLTKSANAAVRFRGYEKLVALNQKHSNTAGALSYARTALSSPHYWQVEVWPPSGCTNQGGSRKHDFKDEFIDSLDVLLPFADLLHLYDSTYNLKDTMMSRDAANWFMRQIEQGRTPPRAGILDRIEPPRNPTEFRRDLLVAMTNAPQFRTALECSLFTHRPDDYPDRGRPSNQVLPRGSLLQPYVMREGLIRVATPSGLSGWTVAPSLRGTVRLWDISADEIVTASAVEPLANTDLNGDGVRDLGLSTMSVFFLDGKGLTAVHLAARKGAWATGVYRGKSVELRGDTLWLQRVGKDTLAATVIPVSRKAKKGVCKPGSCFYIAAMPNPNDSFAWISAVGERGTVWTTQILVGKGGVDAVYQVDSTLIVTRGDSTRLLSSRNGALRGQMATSRRRGVFFNRSGYAVAKGDSVIYRDYSGSRELGVAVGNSDTKLFPPFAPSFESDIWGLGRFGQPLCPIAAEAIPVVYDRALHLISLTDGRELATVAMSENYYDCHYDERGVYVSDDTSFRAITWEGKPLAVADLPLLSYPIWDGDRIVSYYSKPMGVMFEAGAASRLADAVRPLKSRWPAMDDRRQYGE